MLSVKNTCCAAAMLGMLSVATMALATDIGDAVIVNNYYTQNGDVDINGVPVSGSAYTLKATESMTFTGTTLLDSTSGTSFPSNVIFDAPEINMESKISIANNGKNSITFNNALVNFDKATWDTSTAYQGPIAFSGESGIKITSNSLTKDPLITASKLSGDVNLVIENGAIADGATVNMNLVNNTAGTVDTTQLNVNKNNPLYNIQDGSTAGSFGIAQKSESEIAAGGTYTDEQAALLKAMMGTTGNAMFDSITTLVQMGKAADVAGTLDKLRPATGAAQAAAFDTTVTTLRAIFNHLMPAHDEGILAGMKERNHLTFWVEGLYNHTRNDMKKQGFDMHNGGFALGMDTFITSSTLLGIGYSQTIGRFDTKSDGKTDQDGYTGFVYGAWKPSQFFIATMANYTRMRYEHNNKKWASNVYGGNGTIGYEWGWIAVGLSARYIYVDSDSYDNGYGVKVKPKDADLLTGVFGVQVQKAFKDEKSNWRLVPSGRVAATYDVKQADDKTAISYNGTRLYVYEGEKLKRWGMETSAGLKLTNGPAEISVNYEGAFRKRQYSNGAYATLKYHF